MKINSSFVKGRQYYEAISKYLLRELARKFKKVGRISLNLAPRSSHLLWDLDFSLSGFKQTHYTKPVEENNRSGNLKI